MFCLLVSARPARPGLDRPGPRSLPKGQFAKHSAVSDYGDELAARVVEQKHEIDVLAAQLAAARCALERTKSEQAAFYSENVLANSATGKTFVAIREVDRRRSEEEEEAREAHNYGFTIVPCREPEEEN